MLLSVGLIFSWSAVFTEINHLVPQRELLLKNCFPIPPYTQHHFLWMKTGVWLVVLQLACPTISSIPPDCTVSTFQCLAQFVLKTERFCYVQVENSIKKVFSLMWNPDIKIINITNLVPRIFKVWCDYFEYVSYLPHGVMLGANTRDPTPKNAIGEKTWWAKQIKFSGVSAHETLPLTRP